MEQKYRPGDDPLTEQRFLEHWKLLLQAHYGASQDFDKAIMTLSSGGLIFSLAFIEKVVPNIQRGTITWLLLAWIAFGMSLLITVVSYLTTRRVVTTIIEAINSGSTDEGKLGGGKAADFTNALTFIAGGSLLAGVTLLVIFAWMNLKAKVGG